MPEHTNRGHEKISLGGRKPAPPAHIPLGSIVGKLTAATEASVEVPRIELEARHAPKVMADAKLRRQVIESHLKHGHQPVAGITINSMPSSKSTIYQFTHNTKGWLGKKKTSTVIVDKSGNHIA
jgi:light-regulated signal transduction histidine kinase (bacteriophytochrome)